MTDFPTLSSPFAIGGVVFRNRIVVPPHGTLHSAKGMVSERNLAYYEERARGGAGAVVVSGWTIAPGIHVTGRGADLLTDPRVIPGFRRLTDLLHRHDTVAGLQLHWSGRQSYGASPRRPLLSPSAIRDPLGKEIPKSMEAEDIDALVEDFALAAEHAAESGFDLVEIMAGQGYGLNQFLSPHVNRRHDDYGGSLENRARLLHEVVDTVRRVVGGRMLVGVRHQGDDLVEGGFRLSESIEVAQLLATTGVDYLNITGSTTDNNASWIGDMDAPPAQFVPLASAIRRDCGLPIAVTGQIASAEVAEEILESGHADLIGMNRALIADPHLPRKIIEGRLDDVRPCLLAGQGCVERVNSHAPMGCTVNVRAGNEMEIPEPSAIEVAAPRRVVVVGGGPAGMEAALGAAARGHDVTLLEEQPGLGGQLGLAAKVRSRQRFGLFLGFQQHQLDKLGVDVRLGKRATAADVMALEPDAVVVATGSSPDRTGYSSSFPSTPSMRGSELDHVTVAADVLGGTCDVGDRILVAEDDPHVQATTVADFLSEEDRAVTIVTNRPHVGISTGERNLLFLHERLARRGVELIANTWIEEITKSAVIGFNVFSRRPVDLGRFDTVVLATGNVADDALWRQLRDEAGLELWRVGDCLAPRMLDNAVWEGAQAGREVCSAATPGS